MLATTWIITGTFAALNLLGGAGKALTPWDRLSKKMPWTETTGRGAAYLAAWSEIVGAIGAVVGLVVADTLPGWGWAKWLSFAAVVGLCLIQVLASVVHAVRREYTNIAVNVVLMAVGIAASILIALH